MDVQITVSDNARQIIRRLRNDQGLHRAIARAQDLQNQITVGHIQERRLTGPGPFPPADHRLGVRTNRLRNSLRATRAVITGNVIRSTIGTNVKYAGIHEFGGTIKIKAHQRKLRFKTVKVRGQKEKLDKKGNVVQEFVADTRVLAKQGPGNRLWVFAKRNDKDAQEAWGHVNEYEIHMPARAPIRTGIQDRAADYANAISQAVSDFYNRS